MTNWRWSASHFFLLSSLPPSLPLSHFISFSLFTCFTLSHVSQICREKGSSLLELDISSCPSLTDRACTIITKHLTIIESLGMRNLREVSGMGLYPLFQGRRGREMHSIALSGSKNVRLRMCCILLHSQ